MVEKLWSIREEVKKRNPLVYNITNNVVTNFTANVLLAVGASPIVSEGLEEAEDLSRISDVLVINIGTLQKSQVEYFRVAGEYAQQYGKPIVLDPVGVGATGYRNETALNLIKQFKLSLIRGNYGEINFLAGIEGRMKGVDSKENKFDTQRIEALAKETGSVVAATGQVDYVSDGSKVYDNFTGHSLLQMVTGTGCALSSVMGAFIAVNTDDMLTRALAALAYYGAAAEKAAVECQSPGSFAFRFLDSLHNISETEFRQIVEKAARGKRVKSEG